MNEAYEAMVEKAQDYKMAKKVMEILDQHVGKENAIKRYELVCHVHGYSGTWGVSEREDRVVRMCISNLQELGIPILSNSHNGGYFLAQDRKEIFDYLVEIQSRIGKLETKAKILRGVAYGILDT